MRFDIQPLFLQNNILKLIPLHENDFEELYQIASDPLVWEQHPNKTRYQKDVFKNYFEGAMQSKGAFIIKKTDSNETVGCTRFYDFNLEDNSIIIGYTFIGRQFWGKDYNKTIKKLMLDYAFEYVNKVYFHIGAFNIRSQKAIEKIGATKIDEFEVKYYAEEPKLNYIYQIVKS
jgi:N-acetyltransferase